jgi:hypothetical protein
MEERAWEMISRFDTSKLSTQYADECEQNEEISYLCKELLWLEHVDELEDRLTLFERKEF